MSTAVELALDSVTGRPTEPLMLDKPLSVDELPTPALVLDREVMAANIKTMAQHLSEHGKGFRPHAKTQMPNHRPTANGGRCGGHLYRESQRSRSDGACWHRSRIDHVANFDTSQGQRRECDPRPECHPFAGARLDGGFRRTDIKD